LAIQPAHYLIFHPERKRERVTVRATALQDGALRPDWQGSIWVDKPPGNEDPLVLVQPWVFSYCHATQLRREDGDRPYVRPGSWLIFCSGQEADRDRLTVDTVFYVGERHFWNPANPGGLPDAWRHRWEDRSSRLWTAHLRFGIHTRGAGHRGRFTYEARHCEPGAANYSFLPLNGDGVRASVPLDRLPAATAGLIRQKRWGKFPVPLLPDDAEAIVGALKAASRVLVLGEIDRI
jgi:hypothetical protein